jgi:glycosyltransferase involved in cell wall biosynthesis
LLINFSFLSTKPTGISIYANNLIPHLKSLNPTLLTSQNLPEYKTYSIPSNLTPEQGTKGHFNRLLWTQFQLPKIYTKLKSNLLFSPIPEAPLWSNCRSVVMVHDLIPLRFPKRFSPLTPYFRYYLPEVISQAEHIICNSLATAKDITDFFHVPANKITPILLAYNHNHFRPLNLPRKNYFLYIGRCDVYKNIERVITAFSSLDSDVELWIVGPVDSRYTPKLKIQVKELQLTEKVKFLDYVTYDELPIIINQAIALVFPSLWEGFGLPVLEAMACGTPVITSNISSLPEVAGDAAILVNPYHSSEIAAAMQSLINEPQLCEKLRQNGIIRASQFSWEKTGKATVEVLQQYL